MATSLIEVKGIGPSTVDTLMAYGIKSVQDLAEAKLGTIVAIPGFSEIRATKVIAAAKDALEPTFGSGGSLPTNKTGTTKAAKSPTKKKSSSKKSKSAKDSKDDKQKKKKKKDKKPKLKKAPKKDKAKKKSKKK